MILPERNDCVFTLSADGRSIFVCKRMGNVRGEEQVRGGYPAFLADLTARVEVAQRQGMSSRAFILASAERYSYIRLADLWRPLRFLRQLSGKPPQCFGVRGFRHALVDDQEPARHYTAFVFVGYWLPTLLALPVLWLWELLGLVRYGSWSQPDIRSGTVGIRHGRAVRKAGFAVLPTLVARDLSAEG